MCERKISLDVRKTVYVSLDGCVKVCVYLRERQCAYPALSAPRGCYCVSLGGMASEGTALGIQPPANSNFTA